MVLASSQFVEMATPKMQSRDTREEIQKVRWSPTSCLSSGRPRKAAEAIARPSSDLVPTREFSSPAVRRLACHHEDAGAAVLLGSQYVVRALAIDRASSSRSASRVARRAPADGLAAGS